MPEARWDEDANGEEGRQPVLDLHWVNALRAFALRNEGALTAVNKVKKKD